MKDTMIKECGSNNKKAFKDKKGVPTAIYIRLSREDGDKTESLSIVNQRMQLINYIDEHCDLILYRCYIDDGYTGTNFDRPAFKEMIQDIEEKKVGCVIVKDLSRLGRELAKTTEYIQDYFPNKKVRFIAISDSVDKNYLDFDTGVDVMIDFKNMFNGFYPKDIARKVRSTIRAKQNDGQFIGAFACYGYKKSLDNHNKLIIDEYPAIIVRRIFNMYIEGKGKNTIAKILNEEKTPCPSEYKKQSGLNYHNGNRLESTSYWTYSTIDRLLHNEFYIGNMVQNKSARQVCKKKAIALPKDKHIIVRNTHESIIDMETWDKTQNLLKRNTKQLSLDKSIHKFAGFLQCGDCGRSMVKIVRGGVIWFNCGSYNRYGKHICSIHSITADGLEQIILQDLNVIMKSIEDVEKIIADEQAIKHSTEKYHLVDSKKYEAELTKLQRKKEQAYEDYSDEIISKKEYLKFKTKYELQIEQTQNKIKMIHETMEDKPIVANPWIEKLLRLKKLEELDRDIIVEMISMIYVYENKTIKIVYNFSHELDILLADYYQSAI